MSAVSDRLRSTTVAVFAVAQVLSAPLTSLGLGPSSDQGPISDANLSPVTPAGYAFAIWGLIYLASLALAAYQVLPSQQARRVHRITGWWLAGAFAASNAKTTSARNSAPHRFSLWGASGRLRGLRGCVVAFKASPLAALR